MWPLGPAAVELEQVTLGWLADLLDLPHTSGYFGTGATMANTIGLALARQAFGEQHGVDVREAGVRALPELAVYGSEELHLSDFKALRTLGLGAACVRKIPIDDRYAMRVDLARGGDRAGPSARRRAGDRDRAGRKREYRRERSDRTDCRPLRT
jgi:aromatic-L-amino-acid decarboxylase